MHKLFDGTATLQTRLSEVLAAAEASSFPIQLHKVPAPDAEAAGGLQQLGPDHATTCISQADIGNVRRLFVDHK